MSIGFPLAKEARKWGRIFAVYAADALIYRAVAFIWLLTDTVPSLIMPLLWLASFNGREAINGYGRGDITAYYLVLIGVTNLVQCHVMWEMARDIKEGRFSAFLMRPFSYLVMQYLGYVAWRILRTVLFVPIFLAAAYFFRDTLQWEQYHFTWEFFAAVFLGHLLSFFIVYAFGLLALYFVETQALFNFWYMPFVIFSGQVAPLDLFPPYAAKLANLLPFRYIIALPVEIYLGKTTPQEAHHGLLMQCAWLVAAYILGVVLWRNGLKRFTGVGL